MSQNTKIKNVFSLTFIYTPIFFFFEEKVKCFFFCEAISEEEASKILPTHSQVCSRGTQHGPQTNSSHGS